MEELLKCKEVTKLSLKGLEVGSGLGAVSVLRLGGPNCVGGDRCGGSDPGP